jgi:LmbE family N-acetylglucosaminyl deacetylase
MTHVFVAPHPDDAALSCGGLIASLRELGQNVTIISVFSGGPTAGVDLTDYQREALGYGTKALWPNTQTFRRDNIPSDVELQPTLAGVHAWAADPERISLTQDRANTQARQFWQRAAWTRSANITNLETSDRPLADSVPGQGSELAIDYSGGDAMTMRKVEDERYAYFMEASVILLDLPDAVFRGYADDDELLGPIREDDLTVDDILRREIARLEPQMVYLPLGVGNHVDHQLCREAGLGLLGQERRWVMPGPDYIGRVTFYEDFPYAWWHDFNGLNDLPDEALTLPPGVELEARYSDITEEMERKAAGLRLYASQVKRLFESDQGMLDDLAGYHRRVALQGGVEGFAERYWTAVRP